MEEVTLIYITCSDVAQAEKIGKSLLEKRLCGCINIIPDIRPFYFWPPGTGNIEGAREAVLLVKTFQEYFENVANEVKALHSYSTPCILSIPVSNINREYREWLQGELKGAGLRGVACP